MCPWKSGNSLPRSYQDSGLTWAAKMPPLEVQSQISALLEKLDFWPGLPLQSWRALAVLERIAAAAAFDQAGRITPQHATVVA